MYFILADWRALYIPIKFVCFNCIQKRKKKKDWRKLFILHCPILQLPAKTENIHPSVPNSGNNSMTHANLCILFVWYQFQNVFFWGGGVLLRFKWLQNVNSFFSYPSPVACIIIDGLSDPCCKFGPGFGCCPLRTLLKICFFTPLAWTEPPCPFKFVKRTCLS